VLSLSDDLPVAVVMVDARDKIDAFVPQLAELLDEGLVTVEDVEVVRPAGRPPASGDEG
jgi:PII-like signaling protein